jgi:hypothetical protein
MMPILFVWVRLIYDMFDHQCWCNVVAHDFFGVAGLFEGVSANPTVFLGDALGAVEDISYSYHTPLTLRLSLRGGGVIRLPITPNGAGDPTTLDVSDAAELTFICDMVFARLSMPRIIPSHVFASCDWFFAKFCIWEAVVFMTALICS